MAKRKLKPMTTEQLAKHVADDIATWTPDQKAHLRAKLKTEARQVQHKIKPSDLEVEAARLRAEGKMPSLEQILNAVAETRNKYADKIRAARKHRGAELKRVN